MSLASGASLPFEPLGNEKKVFVARQGILQIRVSEAEEEHMKRLAEEAGVSVSSLIRDHISKVRVRNREDEKARLRILTRINSNLNMIARWVNTYRGGAEPVQVISALLSLERAIGGLVTKQERVESVGVKK